MSSVPRNHYHWMIMTLITIPKVQYLSNYHLLARRNSRMITTLEKALKEWLLGSKLVWFDIHLLLHASSEMLLCIVLADPWFWSRAYNDINSVVSASAMIDLTVLDFYFYTAWFKCRNSEPGAYYLDLRTSKDLHRLEDWRNSLTLKNCSLPQVPVVFFLQSVNHWPYLVVFNYNKGMVLLLGRGNNVEEFVGHPDWNQSNGNKLWTEISATMGWLQTKENPRIIEANWIPVSKETFESA
jgi:hypothetical protein